MVYSNINGTVFYKEDGHIDTEDVGYESTLYEMEIFGKKTLIVFGKVKYTFIQRNIVYVPIYLVVYNKIVKQIGVLEFTKNDTLELLDQDNDIIIDKIPHPLMFGFVDENFVDKSGSSSESFQKDQSDMQKDEEKEEEEEEELDAKKGDSDNDEDDVFQLKAKPSRKTGETKIAEEKLKDGIFTMDTKVKKPDDLLEETEETAKQIRQQFQDSSDDLWIQSYMKNANYSLHDVERNGDCFFAVIRDAFKQQGHITTVAKLRAILAKELTEDVFEEHRKLYIDLTGTINEYNRGLTEIKTKIEKDLNVRAKKSKNNQYELRAILNEIKDLKEQHKQLLKSKQLAKSMIDDDVGDFSTIDSVEKFREFIQTPGFWADSWAIQTLERVLNVKFIILSERAYIEDDLHNVLLCGEDHTSSSGNFKPDFYIITTFSGNHYQNIEYKEKRIFKFFEIPFHIKTLILNKCLERNAGPFYKIPEFKDLKTKMGVDEDGGSDDEAVFDTSLYESNTVFEFHRNSNNTSKPGKGTNEKIPNDKRSDFIELSKIDKWRRKLDDSWSEAPFTVDGKKWLSIEHYYQSSKFKKQNPNFSLLFSLDTVSSEIAKDVDLAISAGSKNGRANAKAKKKLKSDNTLLRPKDIEVDPDFYGDRSEKTREEALFAKFSQNEDLKILLVNTRKSTLIHYIHGSPGEKDELLMKIRQKLATE